MQVENWEIVPFSIPHGCIGRAPYHSDCIAIPTIYRVSQGCWAGMDDQKEAKVLVKLASAAFS